MVSLANESRVLVIGLKHAGKQFEKIRHSIGGHLLFKLSQQLGLRWLPSINAAGCYTSFRRGNIGPEIILYQPTGFVNSCGFNVERAINYFEIESSLEKSLYVVHDEMELKTGRFKYQAAGFSLKGHNGLKSIANRIGGNNFNRFKIGIGRPHSKAPQSVADWVMGNFEEQELRIIEDNCIGELEKALPNGEHILNSTF